MSTRAPGCQRFSLYSITGFEISRTDNITNSNVANNRSSKFRALCNPKILTRTKHCRTPFSIPPSTWFLQQTLRVTMDTCSLQSRVGSTRQAGFLQVGFIGYGRTGPIHPPPSYIATMASFPHGCANNEDWMNRPQKIGTDKHLVVYARTHTLHVRVRRKTYARTYNFTRPFVLYWSNRWRTVN
jgi:hypothetical protein